MRIAYLVHQYPPERSSGTEIYTHRIARAMRARGHDVRAFVLPACKAQTVLMRPPGAPWRIEVTADTFVPAEVDPRSGDRRELGARVDFGFVPLSSSP